MKTWEMIKKLTENPKLIFKCQDGGVVRVEKGIIILNSPSGEEDTVDGNLRILDNGEFKEDRWELIREPVNFMTAVNDGRNIMPVGDYYKKFGFNSWTWWDLSLDIVNGKWHIE